MNLREYLISTRAVDMGDYYILECPKCGHREAYVYKGDLNKALGPDNRGFQAPIRCNRLNNCGIKTFLDPQKLNFEEYKPTEWELKQEEKRMKEKIISPAGANYLSILMESVERLIGYDMNIRGISNQTLKKHKVAYVKSGWMSLVQNRKDDFGKQYKTKAYENRDLFIPIYSLNGSLDRLLLRSKDGMAEPKEIIVKMNTENKNETFNLQCLNEESIDTIFINEGAFDCLSVIEAVNWKNVSAVGIAGVHKWKNLLSQFDSLPTSRKEKLKIIVLFDNDKAGIENAEKLVKELGESGFKAYNYSLYSYKDCNEFYEKEPQFFRNVLRKFIRSINEK